MTRLRERSTFSATAGCIALMTGLAVALLVYAAMTFAGLVPPVPAQSIVSLTF